MLKTGTAYNSRRLRFLDLAVLVRRVFFLQGEGGSHRHGGEVLGCGIPKRSSLTSNHWAVLVFFVWFKQAHQARSATEQGSGGGGRRFGVDGPFLVVRQVSPVRHCFDPELQQCPVSGYFLAHVYKTKFVFLSGPSCLFPDGVLLTTPMAASWLLHHLRCTQARQFVGREPPGHRQGVETGGMAHPFSDHIALVGASTNTWYLVDSKDMIQCCEVRKKESKSLDSNTFG